jgi:hypothetical protein
MNEEKKLEKEANKMLENYEKYGLRHTVTKEIISNVDWIGINSGMIQKEDEVKMMIIKIIARKTGSEEKDLNTSEIMVKSIEIIKIMVKKIRKDYHYLTKILNVAYEGNNIYNISRGDKCFKINVPPFSIGNENNIRRLDVYDQGNEKFTNYLEEEIFKKEMKLNYDYNIIDAILSRFLWENYKLTREYKLKTMYK